MVPVGVRGHGIERALAQFAGDRLGEQIGRMFQSRIDNQHEILAPIEQGRRIPDRRISPQEFKIVRQGQGREVRRVLGQSTNRGKKRGRHQRHCEARGPGTPCHHCKLRHRPRRLRTAT